MSNIGGIHIGIFFSLFFCIDEQELSRARFFFPGADPHRLLRFTEIGQSFHNIFLIRQGFLSCKASSKANETGQYPV